MAYVVLSGVAVEVETEEVDDLLRKVEQAHGRHSLVLTLQDGAGLVVVNNEAPYVVLEVLPAGVVSAGVVDQVALERDDPELFADLREVDPTLPLWLVVNGIAVEVDPESIHDLLGDLGERFGNRVVHYVMNQVDHFMIPPESAYVLLHHLPAGCPVASTRPGSSGS